jgi:uncharacterized membrane protein
MSVNSRVERGSRLRWLLLGSLALNLGFVGAAGAVALRYSSTVPLTTIARIDHSAIGRLSRIAATLPAADAQVMRTQLRTDAQKISAAQADLRLSQDEVRKSLRAQPFDADAVRTAMTQQSAARETIDQVLHDMIATAAAKMSVVGRNKLADWSASRDAIQPVRQGG